MKWKKYLEILKNLETQVSFQRFVIGALCATIFAMSFLMYSAMKSRRTIIVPSYLNAQVEVSDNYVSPEYISVMGKYLLGLIYNFTPHTVEKQFAEFLRYVPADKYKDIKEKLDAKLQQSKSSALTEYLVLDRFLFLGDNRFAVKGKLTRLVSGRVVEETDLEMEVGYNVENGLFKIESLELLQDSGFERLAHQYRDSTKHKK